MSVLDLEPGPCTAFISARQVGKVVTQESADLLRALADNHLRGVPPSDRDLIDLANHYWLVPVEVERLIAYTAEQIQAATS